MTEFIEAERKADVKYLESFSDFNEKQLSD